MRLKSLKRSVSNNEKRFGFSLLELIVVLVILVALAAAVLPRINGVSTQANAAVDTAVIADMDKAVSLYEARYGTSPSGWDGILTGATGGFYASLNPAIKTTTTGAAASDVILTELTLTDVQLKSLQDAGITGLHYNSTSYTGRPSDSGTAFKSLATGDKVASLFVAWTATTPAWTGHGSTFADKAFNLSPWNQAGPTTFGGTTAKNSFVVFGVGQPCTLRGTTIQDSPIVQSANPNLYYARPLCVYMIPGPSATTSYKAQFVGTFLPDGTCMNDNITKYNTADVPLKN